MIEPHTDPAPGAEFHLIVWTTPGLPWRARVVAADHTERDFATPFELARFLAWPAPPPKGARGKGLR